MEITTWSHQKFFWISPAVQPSSTRIEAKLLAYSATDEVYVHVGIDEDPNTKRHFARSFFTERINATSEGTKFISGLTHLRSLELKRLIDDQQQRKP